MSIRSGDIEAATEPGQTEWVVDQARYERLVRYCRWLSRNPDVAEDLANDTLLEGWRNAHKLTDSAGTDRWLAAIARNVCLRWRRQAGRDGHLTPLPEHLDIAADDDPATAYDRQELSADLSSALRSLPATTRDALRLRYLSDASHAEIAARTDSSEAAVSMRISRGKAQLRQALERGQLATDPGCAQVGPQRGWRETRLWCSRCGQHHQQIRFDDENNVVSFRCPACDDDPRIISTELPLANAHLARMFGGLRQPAAINRRIETWVHGYFRPALGRETTHCTGCGAPARVLRSKRPTSSGSVRNPPGMHIHCDRCGTITSSSLESLVMALPGVSVFRRNQGRVRTLPLRYQEAGGRPAVVMTIQSVSGAAQVDVVSARDTFELLGIHPASQLSSG